MKKPLYITVLTAFALVCALPNAVNLNLPLMALLWIAEITVLLVGELIGTRAGRRTAFGKKYGGNIGAAVSSAAILAAYAAEVLIVSAGLGSTALTVLSVAYYPMGAAGSVSLIINGCNIAAKKFVTFRARHGAPPSPELTLKNFLPHLFAAAGTGILESALIIVFFMLGKYDDTAVRLVINASALALRVQLVNVIGVFIDCLAEKRLVNNILIAAAAVWGLIYNVRFMLNTDISGVMFPGLRESEILVVKITMLMWAAVIAADIVWAVFKLRKDKAKSEVNTQ